MYLPLLKMASYYCLTLPTSHWLYLNKTGSYYPVWLIIQGPILPMPMGAVCCWLQREEVWMWHVYHEIHSNGCRFLKIQIFQRSDNLQRTCYLESPRIHYTIVICVYNFLKEIYSSYDTGNAEKTICCMHWRHEELICGDADIQCSCCFFWTSIFSLFLPLL